MKEESEYERYARLKSGDGAADEYREHSLNMETGVDSHLHPAKKRRTQIKNHLNTIFFWIRRKMCVK